MELANLCDITSLKIKDCNSIVYKSCFIRNCMQFKKWFAKLEKPFAEVIFIAFNLSAAILLFFFPGC